MRAGGGFVVLSLVAAGLAGLTAVDTAAAAPEARPSILMVGDSTMRGMTPAGQDILRADYDLTFDVGGCRRLIEPSCRPVPNALDVIRANPGQDVVVIMTGYNDWHVDAAVDVIVNEATALGTAHVIWLTYRTDIVEGAQKPIAIAEVFREHNRELAAKAPLHPALTVLDWDGYSSGRDDWFIWDGFHISEAGGFALASYLKETIDGYGLSRCAAVVATGTPAGPPTALPPEAAPPGGFTLGGTRRLLDTRPRDPDPDADAVAAPLGAGRAVAVALDEAVPVGADSVFLNVIAVDPCRDGFLTVYPCAGVPLASNVNYVRGQTVANLAAVAIGEGGDACVYSSAQTDVVVDLVATVGDGGLGYRPLPPTRLVDSRTRPEGPLAPMVPVVVPIAGAPGIPADTSAVAVNLTAVDPRAPGYLVAYPCGTVPDVSALNFGAGHDVANLTLTAMSGDGTVCVLASAATDVVVDLVGTFGPGGDRFAATSPTRLVDSRAGGARLGAGEVVALAADEALLLNVTAVSPVDAGFLTTYPCGALPLVSTLNYEAGAVVPNLAPVAPGAGGQVCTFLQQPGHLVVDQLGVFVP